ncbi:hypothetical protein EGH24_09525 [Halonotius terrestris]|uniref:Uncharacterized protein n=1 Tax=Halonotius terrestris TaxID=2487750 RepID=A0A8J8P9Z7_9EURY|nr:hypothetical protein [Halonotius terrestris]TQQ81345.1 hypothetical protein EGH24_09525 [Halonotius terrestris]
MPTRRRVLTGVGVTAALAGCAENIDAELNPNDETPDGVFVVNSTFEVAPLTRASVTVRNPLDTEKRVDVWVRLYDTTESEIATESVSFNVPSDSTSIVPVAFDITGTQLSSVASHATTVTDVGEEPDFSSAQQFGNASASNEESDEGI